jgi:hypothetical protein
MCLSVLIVSDVKSGVGYKAFIPTLYGFHSPLYNSSTRKIIGETYNDSNDADIGFLQYQTGFHILEKLEDVDLFIRSESHAFITGKAIIKVEFSNVVAVGKQYHCDNGLCYVARTMKLLEVVS